LDLPLCMELDGKPQRMSGVEFMNIIPSLCRLDLNGVMGIMWKGETDDFFLDQPKFRTG
jgi:hypothetical protein